MIAAGIVCIVGILQSLNLLGVPALLAKYYAPLGQAEAVSIGRGSSLLSLPAAVADLAILNLGIAIAMLARAPKGGRKWLAGMAILFVLGVVAAAEFSTVIGLVIALIVIVILTGYKRLFLYAVPVAIAGAIALWPVIQMRLTGFQSASGIPVSWEVRLTNLRTYFWPQLFSDNNWILGVRPNARVAVADPAVWLRLDRERLHVAAVGRRPAAARQLPRLRRLRDPQGLRVRQAAGPGGHRRHRHRGRAGRAAGGDAVRSAPDLPRLW